MQLFQINQSEESSKITINAHTTSCPLHEQPITWAAHYRWSTLFVACTDCALLQHCPPPDSALSIDAQLHTQSSAQLRQGQHPMISTYLYKFPIAEVHCIVVCSLHARCLRIICKLPIAEIHSITLCSLHARWNWDTLTVCSLMAAGSRVFIHIIAQFQCLLIN